MLNLPNTITLTRIALVVVFTAVISLGGPTSLGISGRADRLCAGRVHGLGWTAIWHAA